MPAETFYFTLDSLDLKRFKSFARAHTALRPITVLAGPNSAGKTTIIQSLLLLSQSLDQMEEDFALTGPFVSFSSLRDLAFRRPPIRSASIEYQLKFTAPVGARTVAAAFPRVASAVPRRRDSLSDSPRYNLRCTLDLKFAYRGTTTVDGAVRLINFCLRTALGDLNGPSLAFRLRKDRYIVSPLFLPSPYLRHKVSDVVLRGFLPQSIGLSASDSEDENVVSEYASLPPIFRIPLNRLARYLQTDIHYLGPLREAPHRAYLATGGSHHQVGSRGEYAAEVLWREHQRQVDIWDRAAKRRKSVTLVEGVSHALDDLNIESQIGVSSHENTIYQVFFDLGKARKDVMRVNIQDVGFGVSQVLPIIVAGLMAGNESLLILEQPEIHLHPRLQAGIADFLIDLAQLGRRVLIETHSDHLINRLRRRAAEDSSGKISDYLQIAFVQRDYVTLESSVEALRVDDSGTVMNWPPSFLGDTADELAAILKAGIEKRKRAREHEGA